MACYKPIKGWRSRKPNDNGKFYFTLKPSEAYYDLRMEVPCGRCIGCRIQRSQDWALRCYHEASGYKQNCFITLTFNEEHNKKSLTVKDFQLFMKRLRKKFVPKNPYNKKTQKEQYYEFHKKYRIRFFHCGEYGTVCGNCGLSETKCHQARIITKCSQFKKDIGRPHHHACIFNFDFPDKVLWKIKKGNKLYRSRILEELWTDPKTKRSLGFSTIGEVTFESAAYVARYVLKKFNNKDEQKLMEHYKGKSPEYITMSRRPGIGKDWFTKFKEGVYPDDFVLTNKLRKMKPPKYYDYLYETDEPVKMRKIKAKRIAKQFEKEETAEQKKVAEEILRRKSRKLIREIEL